MQTPYPTTALIDLKARTLADTTWQYGDALPAELAMAFPEVVDELIARRAADLTIICTSTAAEDLRTATRMLRLPGTIRAADLTWACRTILQHSKDAHFRSCAQDILDQLQTAA